MTEPSTDLTSAALSVLTAVTRGLFALLAACFVMSLLDLVVCSLQHVKWTYEISTFSSAAADEF